MDAYVKVTGPHAARVVPPGSGVLVGRRPGFAHALAAAPTGLRPTRHRGASPPELRWQPVAGARGYLVIIAADADFLVPEEQRQVSGTGHRPRVTAVGKHFWQIVALSGAGQGTPSKIYSFDIQPD